LGTFLFRPKLLRISFLAVSKKIIPPEKQFVEPGRFAYAPSDKIMKPSVRFIKGTGPDTVDQSNPGAEFRGDQQAVAGQFPQPGINGDGNAAGRIVATGDGFIPQSSDMWASRPAVNAILEYPKPVAAEDGLEGEQPMAS
jgi:hypothetical protein